MKLKPPENFSYTRLIPQDLQEELINLRDGVTRDAWRLGDICEEVGRFCKMNAIRHGKADLYKAVASISGKKARTVREYHRTAQFYDEATRFEYEVLAFDHFRVAVRYGDDWRDALDWCVDQVDALGRPATVEAMQAHFSDSAKGEEEEKTALDHARQGTFEGFCLAVDELITVLESGKLNGKITARADISAIQENLYDIKNTLSTYKEVADADN